MSSEAPTVDAVLERASRARDRFELSLVDDRTLRLLDLRRGSTVTRRRGWLIRRALLAADVIGLTLAFVVAARSGESGSGLVSFREEFILFLLTLPGWVVIAKLYGLYDRDVARAVHSTVDDFGRIFHFLTVGTLLYALTSIAVGVGHPDLGEGLAFWLSALVLLSVARASARALSRRRIEYLQNTVIVGAGEVGQLVAHKFLQHPEYGINLVGFIDSEPKERRPDLDHLALLGPPERLPALVRLLDVERVVIAFSNEGHEGVLDLIRSLKDLDVQVDIVPRLFDLIGPGVHIHDVEGLPLVGLAPPHLTPSSRLLKRTLDLVLSSVALLALLPFFAVVALLIKLDSRGPVIFRQVRMGAGDQHFHVYKLRTMVQDAEARKQELAHLNRHLQSGDARMFKIVDDPRVTRVGRVLRRYFLDELPQLANVLRGEMSLIGPRPLILDEHRHVAAWGLRRLDLKPGMTGAWQVLGRSSISFEEMVKLDYLYVTTWSLATDIRLLFQTIPLVLGGEKSVV